MKEPYMALHALPSQHFVSVRVNEGKNNYNYSHACRQTKNNHDKFMAKLIAK